MPKLVGKILRVANNESDSNAILRAMTPEDEHLTEYQYLDPLAFAVELADPPVNLTAKDELYGPFPHPKEIDFLRRAWRSWAAKVIRAILNTIADQNPAIPDSNDPGPPGGVYSLLRATQALPAISMRTVSGRTVLEPAEPLNAFLNEVELVRIKRCAYEKCKKLFWAGRVDKPCCSRSCGNAYKQQRHRDRQRANRAYEEAKQLRRKHRSG
jgi:hypothetical protein